MGASGIWDILSVYSIPKISPLCMLNNLKSSNDSIHLGTSSDIDRLRAIKMDHISVARLPQRRTYLM